MSTQTHPGSLKITFLNKKTDRLSTSLARPSIQMRHNKFARVLTVWTWVETIFLSMLFYLAVQMNLTGIEWLAVLILAMLILSWIMIVYYHRVSGSANR